MLLIGVIVGVAAVIVLTGVGIAAGIWFRSSRAASQQTLAAQQGAREQDVARAPAGAGPNVANPLPAAPQQVDPPNPPAIGDAPRQRQEPPPVPIMPPQFLGQPPPSFDISKRYRENEIITINIQGIPDERSRKYILERLPALIGTRYLMSSRVSGDVTVVVLAPVNNPEAFARKIDFGTVSSVKGRIINVTAKKLDIPSADADAITQALFDLKSPNLFTRKAALDRLAIADANDRRDEVLKAVASPAKRLRCLHASEGHRSLCQVGRQGQCTDLAEIATSPRSAHAQGNHGSACKPQRRTSGRAHCRAAD